MENVKLGREVVEVMDTDPGHFSMRHWVRRTHCGTVACLAGTALLKSGYCLVSRSDLDWFIRPDGSRVNDPGAEAAKLLGMTWDEQYSGSEDDDCLAVWFDLENGPDRFRKIVEESAGS